MEKNFEKKILERMSVNDEKDEEPAGSNWSTDKLARLPNGHLSHSSTPGQLPSQIVK